SVLITPAPTATTFSVNATGMNIVNYTQTAGSSTLTLSTAGPQQVSGAEVYLTFITGGGTNGIYPIASYPDSTHFSVTMPDTVGRSGSVIISQVSAGYS